MFGKNRKFLEERKKNILYYLSWILNKPLIKPDRLQIDLTHRCNLSCRMCFVKRYPSVQKDELTEEEIRKLIDQAIKLGAKSVIFTGGEPLLRKDIFEICNYCHEKGLISVVVSNGVLIDNKDVASRIIDSHLSCLNVSVDGLEKTHDYFRGEGNFKKAIRGIRYVVEEKRKRKKGPSINAGCIISDKNFRQLDNLARFLEDVGVEYFYLTPLMSDNTDFKDQSSGDFFGRNEQDIYLLEKILSGLRRRYYWGKSKLCLTEEIPFELIVKYYKEGFRREERMCYGGYSNIFITLCNAEKKNYLQPYVRFCMGFGGNVRKKSLQEIWFSKRAGALRKQMKRCNNPCLQSCFYGVTPNHIQKWLNVFYDLSSLSAFYRFIQRRKIIERFLP